MVIIDSDPQDSVWAGWMPAPVVHDMQQLEHGDRLYWLEINVTAQLTGPEPAAAPLPVRADLGRRIADLIRADLAADAASAITAAPSPELAPCPSCNGSGSAVREILIRRRDPEEARALLLNGPLPPDLAQALADEITG